MLNLFLFALSAHACTLSIQNLVNDNQFLNEASDIVGAGNSYYVVLDDLCAITRASKDGSTLEFLNTQDSGCSNSDHEAIFRFPGDVNDTHPTMVICGEDTETCNIVQAMEDSYTSLTRELVDGGEGCHDAVQFNDNKGIEGAVGFVGTDGEVYMVTLIEKDGAAIVYKLSSNTWISQACTSIPVSFDDYSSLDVKHASGKTIVTVVSQKSKAMWVGEMLGLTADGLLQDPAAIQFAPGASYSFPSSYEGVEGVFIETYDPASGSLSGVLASDDQAGSGAFGNSMHSFELDCPTMAPSSSPSSSSPSSSPSSSSPTVSSSPTAAPSLATTTLSTDGVVHFVLGSDAVSTPYNGVYVATNVDNVFLNTLGNGWQLSWDGEVWTFSDASGSLADMTEVTGSDGMGPATNGSWAMLNGELVVIDNVPIEYHLDFVAPPTASPTSTTTPPTASPTSTTTIEPDSSDSSDDSSEEDATPTTTLPSTTEEITTTEATTTEAVTSLAPTPMPSTTTEVTTTEEITTTEVTTTEAVTSVAPTPMPSSTEVTTTEEVTTSEVTTTEEVTTSEVITTSLAPSAMPSAATTPEVTTTVEATSTTDSEEGEESEDEEEVVELPTQLFYFNADYADVIGSLKEDFLEECTQFWQNAGLAITCIDAWSGSIYLRLEGPQGDLETADSQLSSAGMDLPSFPNLIADEIPDVEADTKSNDESEKLDELYLSIILFVSLAAVGAIVYYAWRAHKRSNTESKADDMQKQRTSDTVRLERMWDQL